MMMKQPSSTSPTASFGSLNLRTAQSWGRVTLHGGVYVRSWGGQSLPSARECLRRSMRLRVHTH